MKLKSIPRGAVLLLPALTCLSGMMQPAAAELLLKYDFEGITDENVPNLAPGATVHGTLNLPEQTQILTGETVSVNGVVYLLGKSLKLTPGVDNAAGTGAINDGANGLGAPCVDTGLLLEELAITPSTDYTAMAWVNFGSQTGDNMVFGSSVDPFLHLGARGTQYWSGHYGDDAIGGATVLNQWRHVTWVNEGQTQTIYVDGVSITTGATGAGSMVTSVNVLVGSSVNAGSFVGTLDEVKIFNTVLTPAEIQAERTAGLTSYAGATRESHRLGNDGLTIVLKDSATSQVNPASIVLKFDGAAVTPSAPVKTGDLTTIFYPVAVAQSSPHTWSLTATDQTNAPLAYEGSVNSPYLPATLSGPDGSVGAWGMRELRGTVIDGARDLAHAVEIAQEAAAGTFVDNPNVPVVNHSDPDNAGGKGNFNNDLPFIGDVAEVDDDNVVMVAKTKVMISAAGTWTFDVHSDDGFGMRVKGARFISSNGPGGVDPADPECLVHPAETGDSNTRGVCEFPAEGIYDIEFIAFEEGGGAFWEVAWAQGSFAEEKETAWTLVGNPNDPAVTAIPFTPRWLTPVPGPQGGAGTFGMRVYYSADTITSLAQTFDFLTATERTPQNDAELTFDSQEPFINHRDSGGAGTLGLIGGELDFPGGLTAQDKVVVTAHGRIRITEAGDYTFNVQSDDGFLLRIIGADGTRPFFKRVAGPGTFQMSNPNEMFFEAGTANTDTRGIMNLAAGDYDLEYIMFEDGGGFSAELTYAKGAFPNNADTTWFPVGYAPQATGPLVRPGISDDGWTVLSTPPGADASNLETAEAALIADSTSSNWDVINFQDPEAGSASSIGGDSPWPRNTTGDDNNYAMSATATLVIPVTGEYFIGFRGDDNTSLQIVDQPWAEELAVNATGQAQITTTGEGTVNDRIVVDIGTGDSRTVGRISLAAGNYTIRSVFVEQTGGSSFEIVGAQATPEFDVFAPLPLLAKGASGQPIPSATGMALVSAAAPPVGSLLVTGVTATGNPVTAVQITWGSTAGKNYLVEASTSLVAASWSTVADNIAATGASTSTTVTLAAPFAGGQRVFFRVKEK